MQPDLRPLARAGRRQVNDEARLSSKALREQPLQPAVQPSTPWVGTAGRHRASGASQTG